MRLQPPSPRGLSRLLLLLLLLTAAGSGTAQAGTRLEHVLQMYRQYQQDAFPGVPDLSAADAMKAIGKRQFLILDVRSDEERRVSILPGATDLGSWRAHRRQWQGRPVLAYCTIGYRSGRYTRKLRREGIEAYNLAGGILAWAHAGGPVVDGRTGRPTHRVHVYGRKWNLLPPGWEGIW